MADIHEVKKEQTQLPYPSDLEPSDSCSLSHRDPFFGERGLNAHGNVQEGVILQILRKWRAGTSQIICIDLFESFTID